MPTPDSKPQKGDVTGEPLWPKRIYMRWYRGDGLSRYVFGSPSGAAPSFVQSAEYVRADRLERTEGMLREATEKLSEMLSPDADLYAPRRARDLLPALQAFLAEKGNASAATNADEEEL